jgi:hypothetical protein
MWNFMIFILSENDWGCKIKKEDVSEACSMHEDVNEF